MYETNGLPHTKFVTSTSTFISLGNGTAAGSLRFSACMTSGRQDDACNVQCREVVSYPPGRITDLQVIDKQVTVMHRTELGFLTIPSTIIVKLLRPLVNQGYSLSRQKHKTYFELYR